jgi:HEAT repeat protein
MESENVATRAAAAKAMESIRHELSVRSLIARFYGDTSADVRRECLCALTALDAAEAIPVSEGALKDEAASVRLAAVRAVYRLVGLEGADALARMLHDEDEDVRRRAATCLGWLGHEPLAVKLVPLLRDTNASVRLATLEALGNLKPLAVVDAVIELLDDPEESVQRAAFQGLETITGKQMGATFPEDEDGRRLLIARWRASREKKPSHLQKAALVTASG